MDVRPSFLADQRSQLLVLQDAVAGGQPDAVLLAFETVARARGLSALARASGVSRERLAAAIADPGRPDIPTLRQVIEALLARAAARRGRTAKSRIRKNGNN